MKQKVKAVTAIYDEIGIKELTTNLMNQYFDESFQLLESLEANDDGKSLLKGLAMQLMKREK